MHRQNTSTIHYLSDWRHKQTHAHPDRSGPQRPLLRLSSRGGQTGCEPGVTGYLATSARLDVSWSWDWCRRTSQAEGNDTKLWSRDEVVAGEAKVMSRAEKKREKRSRKEPEQLQESRLRKSPKDTPYIGPLPLNERFSPPHSPSHWMGGPM